MKIKLLAVVAVLVLPLLACGTPPAGEQDTEVITAAEAQTLVSEGALLVDAQNLLDYRKEHVAGAVSIARADIVVNDPYPNLLAPPEQIAEVMGSRGISNDTQVVVYDNNKNMDSARLWWTLKVYGHDQVKVVSGGLAAMKQEGAKITTDKPSVQPAVFEPGPRRDEMIATTEDIRDHLDTPDENTCIVDTRTEEEYKEGTIPGSILLNFTGNNFQDGTYKPVQQIRIRYLEEDIDFDDTVIMFCKTSIRGAQTYLALYNAGYRDLKLYDGAWVEWSANPMNPVYVPDPEVLELEAADNS